MNTQVVDHSVTITDAEFYEFCLKYCDLKNIENVATRNITLSCITKAERANFAEEKPTQPVREFESRSEEIYDQITKSNRQEFVEKIMSPNFQLIESYDDFLEIHYYGDEPLEAFEAREAAYALNLQSWQDRKDLWEAKKPLFVKRLQEILDAQNAKFQDPEYIQFLKLQAKLKDRGMLE